MPVIKWQVLGKGIQVLKLWQSIGPKWPQIAVLRLSRVEYERFLKNPKTYFKEFKVFGKTPTRKVVRCRLVRVDAKKPDAEYVVVGEHCVDCTTPVSSSAKVEF